MTRRAAALALAALAAAPGGAAAQFRERPLVVPAPAPQARDRALLAGAFATTPDAGDPAPADLLLPDAAPTFRAHHALLAPRASPVATPPVTFRCVAAGRLAENADDAAADVVYCAGAANELQIAFGDAPGALRSYTHTLSNIGTVPVLTFARLHPPPRTSDVVVLPVDTGRALPNEGLLYALDVGVAAGAPAMTDRSWPARSIARRGVLSDEVLTMRISPTARASGVDDLYVPGFGTVTLYAHASPAAGRTLADVDFGAGPVKIGGGGPMVDGLDPSQWLPPGVSNNDVLGAAALDVDLDGDLDLVLVLAPSAACPATEQACAGRATPAGRLLWVERSGGVASLATARPWRDLGSHPDLQPLVDPALVRALELGGEPAMAVFDRGTDSVLVVTADPGAGRLRVWRGGAAGREIHALRLADLVGSPAPDLVADATYGTYFVPASSPAVLVWPDAGDASPELAWAGGGLGAPTRGEDLPLAVSARDADGPFTVDFLLGDPYGAPAASIPDVPGGASVEVPWLVDGALLCEAPPQTLAVTVRATDELGVWDELAARAPVTFRAPALTLAGAVPPLRLELPVGGTDATFEGGAGGACGGVTFTWGGTLYDLAHAQTTQVGSTTREHVLLPEAIYPALLAGPATVTLVATEPSSGLESPLASLELDLDARGLVRVAHEADAVALAPGEVTVVRTRLRSRLGVALPGVRLVHALSGLAPAGAPRASGAAIVEVAAGGAEVVLDAVAPGAEVTVDLPVRSLGGRAASAVEARSAGGHLLTPAAAAPSADTTPPGCGCGTGGGSEPLLVVAALGALARRRGGRRPT